MLYSLVDDSRRNVTVTDLTGLIGMDSAAGGKSMWVSAFANTGRSALLTIAGRAKIVLEDSEMTIRLDCAFAGRQTGRALESSRDIQCLDARTF